MVGAVSMMAVICVRSCVMVDLVVSGRVSAASGGVSFSTQGLRPPSCRISVLVGSC